MSDVEAANLKRYVAFISYSQVDRVFAKKLHRALERFRVPPDLAQQINTSNQRKLGRFFRDEEEMAASPDLGHALRGAIADSENLIVVCSPDAARSDWVEKEIRHFRATGRADCIFAVIVDGEPNVTDASDPERSARECFPPSLRGEPHASVTSVDPPARQPLAIDARHDSFARLRARLVAGLLRIPFDTLWKRERRRLLRLRVATGVMVAIAALLVAVTYLQVSHRARVLQAAGDAQELVERRRFSVPGRGASNEPLIGARRLEEGLPLAIESLPPPGSLFGFSGPMTNCGSFGAQTEGRCAGLRIAYGLPEAVPAPEFDGSLTANQSSVERVADDDDTAVWRELCSFPKGAMIRGFARSPSGRYVAVIYHIDNEFEYGQTAFSLVDDETQSCQKFPVLHQRYISDLEFSPSEDKILTASGDNNAVVWDIGSRSAEKAFSHGWHVESIAFIHDNRIATSTAAGDVWVWDLVTEAEILRSNGTQSDPHSFRVGSELGGELIVFVPKETFEDEILIVRDLSSATRAELRRHLCETFQRLQQSGDTQPFEVRDPCERRGLLGAFTRFR